MKYFLLSTYVSFLALAPLAANAGGNLGNADDHLREIGGLAGVGESTVEGTVGTGIGIVLTFVGLIFLVLMVYAGVLWLTARGEEGQVDQARKIIASTVIGLVLVVSAYAITYFVTSQFTG